VPQFRHHPAYKEFMKFPSSGNGFFAIASIPVQGLNRDRRVHVWDDPASHIID
jgi:hypothetical protein